MKNLKTRGSEINSYNVVKTTEKFQGENIEVVHLTVEADRIYKYRVCSDGREPDLNKTKKRLEDELKASVDNFEKFEVKKYEERNYLHINGIQYTGKQLI